MEDAKCSPRCLHVRSLSVLRLAVLLRAASRHSGSHMSPRSCLRTRRNGHENVATPLGYIHPSVLFRHHQTAEKERRLLLARRLVGQRTPFRASSADSGCCSQPTGPAARAGQERSRHLIHHNAPESGAPFGRGGALGSMCARDCGGGSGILSGHLQASVQHLESISSVPVESLLQPPARYSVRACLHGSVTNGS